MTLTNQNVVSFNQEKDFKFTAEIRCDKFCQLRCQKLSEA